MSLATSNVRLGPPNADRGALPPLHIFVFVGVDVGDVDVVVVAFFGSALASERAKNDARASRTNTGAVQRPMLTDRAQLSGLKRTERRITYAGKGFGD